MFAVRRLGDTRLGILFKSGEGSVVRLPFEQPTPSSWIFSQSLSRCIMQKRWWILAGRLSPLFQLIPIDSRGYHLPGRYIGICMKIHRRVHATPCTVCSLIGGTPVFIYPTRDICTYICVCMYVREKFSRLSSNEMFTISSADYVAILISFSIFEGILEMFSTGKCFFFPRYLLDAYRKRERERGCNRGKWVVIEKMDEGIGFFSIFFFLEIKIKIRVY